MKITILGTGAGCAADAVVLSFSGEIRTKKNLWNEIDTLASLPQLPEKIRRAAKKASETVRTADDESEAVSDADFVILPRIDAIETENGAFTKKIISLAGQNRNTCFVVRSKVPLGFTRRLREKGLRAVCIPDLACGDVSLTLQPTHIVAGVNGNDIKTADSARVIAEAFRIFSPQAPIRIMGEDEAETVMRFTDEYLRMQSEYLSGLSEIAAASDTDEQILREGVGEILKELRIGRKD